MKKTITKKPRYLGLKLTFLLFAMLLVSLQGWGQTIAVGTPYTQNFDGIGSTATATLPTGWKMENIAGARTITTAYTSVANTATASALTYNAAMISSAANGRWNFGGTSATDRAIGGISSSSASQSVNMFLQLTNNGSNNITDFTVSFDAERYRNGTNAAGFSIRFYYSTTGLASSWTEVPSCIATFTGGNTDNNGLTTNPMQTINIANKTLSQSLTVGSTIYLAWSYSVTSGTTTSNAQALGIDNITITANGGSIAPSVTTTSATVVGSTSATFNGNITSDGGASIMDRGFCYKTSTGVAITDNFTSETGTSAGTYSKIFSPLSSATNYFCKAYATNSNGTTLSITEINFWTLATEPTGHTSTFTNSVISQTQLDLSFVAASTIANATGYLILKKAGSAPTGVPVDGSAYVVGGVIGDGTVAALVTNTASTSASIGSLSPGTHYYFTIIPFNNGANNATYNYKTDGTIPSTNGTTLLPLDATSELSGPALGSQPNPVLLSSTVTTDAAAVRVFDMDLYDFGGDGQPTKLTQVTIKTGTNNTANWLNTLQGVKLSLDGGSTFTTIGTPTITASSIVIPIVSGNLNIPDADAKTLSLYVYLKTTSINDNQTLEFKVDATASAHEFIADGTGSTFLSTFSSAPVSNQILINVVATKLNFVQQPSNVGTGVNITPAVTVSANDVNGNRDLDFIANVLMTANGASLNSSPVSVAAISGLATFSSLSFPTVATGVTTEATSGTLTNAVSNPFNIILVPAAGEVVINQFNPGYNGATNEYVELLNKTNKTFDLSQVKLMYSSASGSGPSLMGTLSGTLPPYSYWLLSPDATVTVGLTSALTRDGSFSAGMAAAAGQIAIENLGNGIIDGVAYGTITLNKLGEGSPASAPAVSKDGLKRVSDGYDFNNNQTDFVNVANANILLRNHSSLPTAFAVSGTGSYCMGSAGLPVGVANTQLGYSYELWKNAAATGITIIGTGSAITFGNQTVGTYTVKCTNAGGTTDMTESAILSVNSLPTPSITGALTFCSGSPTTLDAGSYSSYNWSPSGNTQTINVSTAGSYAVTVTDGNGCTGASAPVTTIVHSLPTPTVTGTLAFCSGSSTTLDAGSYSGYLWSTGAITQTIPVSIANTYTVTVTNSNNCSAASAPVTTIVNSLPTPSITGALAICSGSPTTLDAGSYSGYHWSTTATTQTISVGAADTYTLTVTDGNGCSGVSAPVTTIVNPLPTVTLDAAFLLIAAGNTTGNLSYSANTAGPITYSIDFDATANAMGFVDVNNVPFSGGTIGVTIPAGAAASDYYANVTVKNGNGCVSNAYPIVITVAGFAFTTSKDIGTALQITWTAQSGAYLYHFEYRISGNSTWLPISAPNNQIKLANVLPNTTYECYVRIYKNGLLWGSSQIGTFTTANVAYTKTQDIGTTAQISWNSFAPWASNYSLQYRKVGNPAWISAGSTSNQVKITNLIPNADYECQVRVYTSAGLWGTAQLGTFHTGVVSFNTSQDIGTTLLMDWTSFAWATNYTLQYRPLGGGSWVGGATTANQLKIGNLLPDTDYEFKLSVYKSGILWGVSGVTTVHTGAVVFTTVADNNTSMDLTWLPSLASWATSYQMQYCSGAQNPPVSWVNMTISSNTTLTISPIITGQDYWVKMRVMIGGVLWGVTKEQKIGRSTKMSSLIENNVSSSGMNIYPNPFVEQINLTVSTAVESTCTWFIYDMNGKVVKSGNQEISIGDNAVRIDASVLAKGEYILNTTIGNDKMSFRILKQ